MVFKVDIPLLLIVLYVSMSSARSLKDGERYTRGAEDAGRNLVDFYQASMPAVMGMLSYNETLQVLQKHFFTDKKEDSIWPKALEETKTWFGEDHKIGELDAIEVDLKKYQHILTRCTAENKGKELTRCLATLKDSLIAGSGNVEWSREQEIPKQLNLFVSFHLMELALLQMLKIQYEKDPISGIDIDRSIKDAAKNFKEVLESSMGTCCEQRTQRIGSLDVCKVTDVLWQEFILECEERIRKRSVSDEDEGSTEDEEEPADTRSNYSFTKDDQGKIKESNIGGKQNDFIESVRARVKDRVTGQYIFNKRYVDILIL